MRAVVWTITSGTAMSRLASDTRLQPAAEAYINSVVLAEIGYSRAKFIYIYRATHIYRGYVSKFMINVYIVYTSYIVLYIHNSFVETRFRMPENDV